MDDELQEQMHELARQMTLDWLQLYHERQIDTSRLRAELEQIPARVYSQVYVHTAYRVSGGALPQGVPAG